MKKTRKHYTEDEKVDILRRHLLDKEPISQLCDESRRCSTAGRKSSSRTERPPSRPRVPHDVRDQIVDFVRCWSDWRSKPFPDWDEDTVLRLLTDSPLANPRTVKPEWRKRGKDIGANETLAEP